MKRNNFQPNFFVVVLLFSFSCIAPLNAQDPDIFIHYLGHSSFIIYFDNGLYVLVDYGTSNSYGNDSPIYSIGDLKPDIITYSHKHQDHYDPTRMPDSVQYILTDFDTLSLAGLNIRPVRTSETSTSVKDNSSFIFKYKGFTLIHLGDAQANIMNINNENNRNYLKQIFPEKIDMLLVTIQGVNRFIPEAEVFIAFLQPKRIIPIHYWSRQYKAEFLTFLEEQNQNAGKNYQIERRLGAKYAMSTSNTSTTPIQVISLEPAIFSDFNLPDLRYKSLELDDSGGNNNGRADAGETVNLVITLTNYWIDAKNVSAIFSEDDPEVQLTNSVINFGEICMDQDQCNAEDPLSFSVSPNSIAHFTTFHLEITADSSYTALDSFQTIIGTPTILLIDDDDGCGYETCYTEALIPETWDVSTKGYPAIDLLQGYDSVIWSTGDDRKSSLTSEEQAVIATFLDNGGRLLICGQNIAFDLDGEGSASDSLFLANYLHVQFVADSIDAMVVLGITGDPITDGMFISLAKTPTGEGAKTSPDIIRPIEPEELIFKYIPGMAGAGVKYEDEATGSRLVYLPFGIEKIIGPKANMAADFLEITLTWLSGKTTIDEELKQSALRKNYWLSQNYPNPFNSSTTIQYSIPHDGFVSVRLYNLLGEELTTLAEEIKTAGTHKINFDGRDYPSGIYFYQLQAGRFTVTKKFLLLR